MLSIRDAYETRSHNLYTGACVIYNKHAVRYTAMLFT